MESFLTRSINHLLAGCSCEETCCDWIISELSVGAPGGEWLCQWLQEAGGAARQHLLQCCSSAAAHALQPALSSQLSAAPGGGQGHGMWAAELKDTWADCADCRGKRRAVNRKSSCSHLTKYFIIKVSPGGNS